MTGMKEVSGMTETTAASEMTATTKEVRYLLRGLTAEDIFPMLKILSGIGIKEFKGCFDSEELREAIRTVPGEDGDGKKDLSAVGVMVALDVASVILSNLPRCKEDIYLLLSGLSGLTKKEIAALPMNVFMSMIIDVIRKEEFKDFFQAVSGLLR